MNRIIFSDDDDAIKFAEKFLTQKVDCLKKDVVRCLNDDPNIVEKLGNPAPFPALLYCFSIIDLLGVLYKGRILGVGEISGFAADYMRDLMCYKPHHICLLQQVFRHKLVHYSEPSFTFIHNNK